MKQLLGSLMVLLFFLSVPSTSYALPGIIKSTLDSVTAKKVVPVLILDVAKIAINKSDHLPNQKKLNLIVGNGSKVIIIKKIENSYTKDSRKTKFLTYKSTNNILTYNNKSLYKTYDNSIVSYLKIRKDLVDI
tara:strand:+ start:125 stop:523 length:399 start_codon:yes stop_codon:yes gene_type:complete